MGRVEGGGAGQGGRLDNSRLDVVPVLAFNGAQDILGIDALLLEFVLQRPRGVVARGYRVTEEGDVVLTRHELPEGVDVGLTESVHPVGLEV